MTVLSPEPPVRQRRWRPRNPAPVGTDVPVALALFVIEGCVLFMTALSWGLAGWAGDGSAAKVDAATLTGITRLEWLLAGAAIAVLAAVLLRAAWTGGSQLLVAGALLVMVLVSQQDYDRSHQVASGPAAGLTATPANRAAGAIATDIDTALNSGFLSPGSTYGGPFTQGTVVGAVEAHGGAVLSMASAGPANGLTRNTFTAVIGAGAPGAASCFSFTFTITHGSAQVQPTACPDAATVAEGSSLLAAQPPATTLREAAPKAYPPTAAGVRSLLHDRFGPDAATAQVATATAPSGDSGTGVLVAAVRMHGVCDFVRLGTSKTITSWVPLWPAPVDDQASCDTRQALEADLLYGSDPAQEG